MGFGVPMQSWLKADLKPLLLHYLDDNRLIRENILDYRVVSRLRDSYLKNKNENAHKLWLILVFEMWYERWAD